MITLVSSRLERLDASFEMKDEVGRTRKEEGRGRMEGREKGIEEDGLSSSFGTFFFYKLIYIPLGSFVYSLNEPREKS